MLPLDDLEMTRDRLDDCPREESRPVLLTFASADHHLPSFEIDIFHAQLQALLQPQPRAIQASHDQPHDSVEVLHDPRDLVAAQDNRDTNRHASARHVLDPADLDVQHVAIHEQHRAERLVLR